MMSINKLAICIFIACLFFLQACNEGEQQTVNKCGINGSIVINSNIYTGTNGFKITLEGVDDKAIIHTAVTGSNGKFEFRDLEAGWYSVDAQKDGYRWIWMDDDGFINHENRLIELKDNKIKDLEILMFSEDYGESDAFDLEITDIRGKPITRIGIPRNASTISLRLFNGTQKSHSWTFQYNMCYVTTGREFEYVFNSFNLTEGVLKSGDNVVLVGQVNPNIFSSQFNIIEGSLYLTDYGSGSSMTKKIDVYFEK